MNVLVWKSLDHVLVYKANTIPQLQMLVTRAGVAMTGWGYDQELLDLIQLVGKVDPEIARQNIESVIMGIGRGDEAFEVFQFNRVEEA